MPRYFGRRLSNKHTQQTPQKNEKDKDREQDVDLWMSASPVRQSAEQHTNTPHDVPSVCLGQSYSNCVDIHQHRQRKENQKLWALESDIQQSTKEQDSIRHNGTPAEESYSSISKRLATMEFRAFPLHPACTSIKTESKQDQSVCRC